MKTLTTCLLILIISSCSPSINDVKKDQMKTAKSNLELYLKLNLLNSKNLSLDSLQIISIDTLNERESLQLKANWLTTEYDRLNEISQNQQDLIKSYEGLDFDSYIIESKQRDLNNTNLEMTDIKNQFISITKIINKSKNNDYRYHLIKGVMHYTENMHAKTFEVNVPANSSFKVVEAKDIN